MADFLAASALVASQTVNLQEDFNTGSFMSLSSIISLMIMIFAGYLAWGCNKGKSVPVRIIWTILAMLFGTYYLMYYLVAHKALPAMGYNEPNNRKFFACDATEHKGYEMVNNY